MTTMTMNEEERFEADLRAAMAPEPASAALRHRVLAQAMPHTRTPKRAASNWRGLFDPRTWRLPVMMELGAAAAVASLAVGIFAGASGIVPSGMMPGETVTTVASADTGDSPVDLVALAYDSSGIAGDLQ